MSDAKAVIVCVWDVCGDAVGSDGERRSGNMTEVGPRASGGVNGDKVQEKV